MSAHNACMPWRGHSFILFLFFVLLFAISFVLFSIFFSSVSCVFFSIFFSSLLSNSNTLHTDIDCFCEHDRHLTSENAKRHQKKSHYRQKEACPLRICGLFSVHFASSLSLFYFSFFISLLLFRFFCLYCFCLYSSVDSCSDSCVESSVSICARVFSTISFHDSRSRLPE